MKRDWGAQVTDFFVSNCHHTSSENYDWAFRSIWSHSLCDTNANRFVGQFVIAITRGIECVDRIVILTIVNVFVYVWILDKSGLNQFVRVSAPIQRTIGELVAFMFGCRLAPAKCGSFHAEHGSIELVKSYQNKSLLICVYFTPSNLRIDYIIIFQRTKEVTKSSEEHRQKHRNLKFA